MIKIRNTFILAISIFLVVACGGKEETSTEKPEDKTISVTGVSISKSSLELTVGETAQLSATVSPRNATNTGVKWNSGNNTIATVEGGGS